MPGDIDEHSAPGKPRMIFDRDSRNFEAIRTHIDQLEQCFNPVKDAEGVGGTDRGTLGGDRQTVRLVFGNTLD
jgi:hypothetical protein